MNKLEALELLNSMEIMESSCSCGECEYVLVEDDKKNRDVLHKLGALDKEIEEECTPEGGYLDISPIAWRYANYFRGKDNKFSLVPSRQEPITDVQHARAIIDAVGEPYQKIIDDKLRTTFYGFPRDENEQKAQVMLSSIEDEYALETASTLWKNKFEQIPEHIKNYNL